VLNNRISIKLSIFIQANRTLSAAPVASRTRQTVNKLLSAYKIFLHLFIPDCLRLIQRAFENVVL